MRDVRGAGRLMARCENDRGSYLRCGNPRRPTIFTAEQLFTVSAQFRTAAGTYNYSIVTSHSPYINRKILYRRRVNCPYFVIIRIYLVHLADKLEGYSCSSAEKTTKNFSPETLINYYFYAISTSAAVTIIFRYR